MNDHFKGFNLEKCLGFASEESEKDIVLLEREYNLFKNTYSTYFWQYKQAKKFNALDPQFLFAWNQAKDIKSRFDSIFKKLGFEKEFIWNLWDKTTWSYFPSWTAITKKYVTIFVNSNYSENKKDINYCLTAIRFIKWEIAVCSIKELYSILLGLKLKAHSIRENSIDLLNRAKELKKFMKDEDYEEVMYCLLGEKEWKNIYTTFANQL